MTRVYRFTVMALLMAAVAHAQTSTPHRDWEHATELAGVAAAASVADVTDLALGGLAGWDLSPHVTIEGRGLWLNRGTRDTAFTGDLGALLRFGSRQTARPYVGGGFGLYRESVQPQSEGVPKFYRDRLTPGLLAGQEHVVFTDPAVRLTAGMEFIVHRHVTLRPELSTLLVWGGDAHQTVVMAGLRVGYRFEDHPVTPRVR